MTLDSFMRLPGRDTPRLERSTLKTQSTDLLRAQIISGRIPQGTRISEVELAELLGVSRMPARDALIDLEHEGLIVSKPNGRYVIHIEKEDIQNLFQVRIVLERLAVSQAAQQRSPDDNEAIQADLQRMRQAITQSDRDGYVKTDLEAHQLIWQQARNPYLLKMLNSIVGPIFMFMGSQIGFDDWSETMQMHQELTDAICAGDVDRAVQSIDTQLQYSLRLSLQAFEQTKPLFDPLN